MTERLAYTSSMTISQIKKKAIPILKEAGVMRASVFGSIVRGDATERSDIDMLVDVPDGTGLFAFIGLQQKLESVLGKKVDLLTYRSVHPRIKQYIEQNQLFIL